MVHTSIILLACNGTSTWKGVYSLNTHIHVLIIWKINYKNSLKTNTSRKGNREYHGLSEKAQVKKSRAHTQYKTRTQCVATLDIVPECIHKQGAKGVYKDLSSGHCKWPQSCDRSRSVGRATPTSTTTPLFKWLLAWERCVWQETTCPSLLILTSSVTTAWSVSTDTPQELAWLHPGLLVFVLTHLTAC